LQALLKALDLSTVNSILRSSKNTPRGQTAVDDRFEFDEIQADAMLRLRSGS
jgi:DNA gyrase/topoisomerase IV subunit A